MIDGTTESPGAAGPRLVDYLFSQLVGGDIDWCLRTSSGFAWWPSIQRQDIHLFGPRDIEGHRLWRLSISMTVAKGADPTNRLVRGVIDHLNQAASLSGVLIMPSGDIALGTSFVVHEQNFDWVSRIAQLAAGLQLTEAQRFAAGLEAVGACIATDPHPDRGPRPDQDELVDGVLGLVMNAGQSDVGFQGWEPFSEMDRIFTDEGWFTNSSPEGLTTEAPFGSETALLRVDRMVRHPYYGAGVLFLLRLPISPLLEGADGQDAPGTFADLLNRGSLSTTLKLGSSHHLGGWSEDPKIPNTLCCAAFLPASLAEPNVVLNLGVAIGVRAAQLGRDLGEAFLGPGPSRPAIERLMEL
jgi:hypothetical protein